MSRVISDIIMPGFPGEIGIRTAVSAGTDTDADALFTAMEVQPDATRKTLIRSLITALKSADIWAHLDLMYVMAAHTSQATLLNWKNPAVFLATTVGSPTFVTDRGYTGDSNNYFKSPFIPSSNGVLFALDNASMWAWPTTNLSWGQGDIFEVTGTGRYLFNVLTGGYFTYRLNGTTTSYATTTDSRGMFGIQRANSTSCGAYRNGSLLLSDATTSSAISTSAIGVCASTRQQALLALGDSLSGKESAFYSAMLAYMQGVGAA